MVVVVVVDEMNTGTGRECLLAIMQAGTRMRKDIDERARETLRHGVIGEGWGLGFVCGGLT